MVYNKYLKLSGFVNFKFLIVHSICLSACVGELSLRKGSKYFIETGKHSCLSFRFTWNQVGKVLMLKNFLPRFYEQVKQGYEIGL